MKLKFFTLILAGLAVATCGMSTNQQTGEIVHADGGTYVLAYSNPCAALNVQPAGYDAFTKVFDVDGVSWRIQGYPRANGWGFGGGKTATSGDRTYYTVTPIEQAITKIEMSTGTPSANTISVNKITLNVYSSVDSDNVLSGLISTQEQSWADNSTITFINESGKDWANAYYEFVYDTVITATSNVYKTVTGFNFYKTVTGDSVTLDTESIELKTGGEATIKAAASNNVVWSSEPNDVVEITTSGDLNEVANITAVKAGNATITATVGTASATCAVTVEEFTNKFEKITDLNDLNYGDVIAFVFLDANVAVTSVESNSMKSTSQLVDSMVDEYMAFQVTKGFEGKGYAFVSPDGKYLNNTSDSYLTLAGTLSIKSSWDVAFTDGVLKITNQNTQRWLSWRIPNNYARAYKSEYNAEYVAPSIFRYSVSTEAEINEAISYATLFLQALRTEDVCDVNGVNTNKKNLNNVWATYAASYKELSDGAKAYIASAKANVDGNELEVLLNTYEFITTKYQGDVNLVDFMFRNVAQTNNSLGLFDANNDVITIIIVIILSSALVGLFFIIRKRRLSA